MEITKIDDNNFVADGVYFTAKPSDNCRECHLARSSLCSGTSMVGIDCRSSFRSDCTSVIWLETEHPPLDTVSPKATPAEGLVPEHIYDAISASLRAKDIVAAMQRYIETEKPIPVEWAQELVRRLS